MNELFQRLKQRKLVQWAIAYVGAAFALLQGIDIVAQQFGWSESVRRGITLALVVGFFVTLVLAWYHGERGAQRVTGTELLIIGMVLALGGGSLWRFAAVRKIPNEHKTTALPEKAIAVLPFESLSDQRSDAYFADGMQAEILRGLVKIADLKVISRPSVANLPNLDLSQIGYALGARYLLEGSVQRVKDRIRVQAQLYNAMTGAQIWVEHYDRQLLDVFAIQSEIAETIVNQLQARFTPEEKAAIEVLPTQDIPAYASYVKANDIIDRVVYESNHIEDFWEAERLLEQATERDPTFFLAFCRLAYVHDQIYFNSLDHSDARLGLAAAALDKARELQPGGGEVHLATAAHYYFGYRDYEKARQDLTAARAKMPNDPYPILLLGYIDRRQGRWDESTKALEQALSLDPRNLSFLKQLALSYSMLRRYPDVIGMLDRASAIAPDNVTFTAERASVELDWHANTKPLHAAIEQILARDATKAKTIADQWLLLALCEKDLKAASEAIEAMTENGAQEEGLPYPRAWCEGLVARENNDTAAARLAFTEARGRVDRLVHEEPDFAAAISALGMIDAALGNKEDAIAEGRKAIDLLPTSKDAITGSTLLQNLAVIYSWTGEQQQALDTLNQVVGMPGYLSYGQLSLHPYWTHLRNDPGFSPILKVLQPSP